MNIAAECADCCTCPTPTVLWDSPQAIATPCGYSLYVADESKSMRFRTETTRTEINITGFAEQDIERAYPTDALSITGSSGMASSSCPSITETAEWTTNASSVACAGSVPYTDASIWPEMEYGGGALYYDYPVIRGSPCAPEPSENPSYADPETENYTAGELIFEKVLDHSGSGTVGFTRLTYGSAWTLAELQTELLALTMTFSGSFLPEGGSRLPGSVLSVTEDVDGSLLGIRRKAKYRFTASPTAASAGRQA